MQSLTKDFNFSIILFIKGGKRHIRKIKTGLERIFLERIR